MRRSIGISSYHITIRTTVQQAGIFVFFRLWRFVRIADHTLFNRRVGRIPAQVRRREVDDEMKKVTFALLQRCVAKTESFDFAATVKELTG